MNEVSTKVDVPALIIDILVTQREAKGAGLSICPTQVAKRIAQARETPELWRKNLALVRRTAVEMASQGDIAITRKGKPVDQDDFKGVYRLALPLAEPGPGKSEDE